MLMLPEAENSAFKDGACKIDCAHTHSHRYKPETKSLRAKKDEKINLKETLLRRTKQ